MPINEGKQTNVNLSEILEGLLDAGIDFIDLVRKEYPKYSHLPAKNIFYSNSCPLRGDQYYTIERSESEARSSGLFIEKVRETVNIPEGFISKFVKLKDKPAINVSPVYFRVHILNLCIFKRKIRCEENIERVYFSYELDVKELLKSWAEAGYPKNWT